MNEKTKLNKLLSKLDGLLEKYCEDVKNNPKDLDIIFTLAQLYLVKNTIDDARALFEQGARLFLREDGSIRTDIGTGYKTDIENSFAIYLGNTNVARLFIPLAIPEIRNKLEPRLTIIMKDIKLLQLHLLIDDKEKVEFYRQMIRNKIDGRKLDADGWPRSENTTSYIHGYASNGLSIVDGIVEKKPELFEKGLSTYSKLLLKGLHPSDSPYSLVSLEFVILYDLALGAGLHPKVDSVFIPKAIIENGYWNKP